MSEASQSPVKDVTKVTGRQEDRTGVIATIRQ